MTTARPIFSVIVPTFNAGDKALLTARSVLDQTADLELLIVDGASTDGSLSAVQELAAADPERVRLHSGRDKGIYDAMNRGIAMATGRYLYFIGCGDKLLPGALGQVAAELPADDRTLVYGDTWWNGERYDGKFTSHHLRVANLPHQAAFYGRDIFELLGHYEIKYRTLADWAFNMAIFGDRRIRRKYIDVVVAHYEGGGASETVVDQAFQDDRAMLERRLGWMTTMKAKLHGWTVGRRRRR